MIFIVINIITAFMQGVFICDCWYALCAGVKNS